MESIPEEYKSLNSKVEKIILDKYDEDTIRKVVDLYSFYLADIDKDFHYNNIKL